MDVRLTAGATTVVVLTLVFAVVATVSGLVRRRSAGLRVPSDRETTGPSGPSVPETTAVAS
jgi:hypothetical protein